MPPNEPPITVMRVVSTNGWLCRYASPASWWATWSSSRVTASWAGLKLELPGVGRGYTARAKCPGRPEMEQRRRNVRPRTGVPGPADTVQERVHCRGSRQSPGIVHQGLLCITELLRLPGADAGARGGLLTGARLATLRED